MKRQLTVVMDPLESIKVKKDSTLAIMLEAQNRGWQLYYTTIQDLFLEDGVAFGLLQPIEVDLKSPQWYQLTGEPKKVALHTHDVTLMRKDPPFDLAYLYATILLELAQRDNHLVLNNPQALRDANEKLFTSWFPELCPPTLVTSQMALIRPFLEQHKKIIFKPLDSMGGQSVFLIQKDDPNFNVIVENLTQHGTRPIMIQKFISESAKGDKRILMIDGKAYPYALLRVPKLGEFRGNLAAGAKGIGCELTKKELEISQKVGPVLKEKGILFAGLDVIGEQLTEINVTSPTCIREIDAAFNVNVSQALLDAIESKLAKPKA